MIKIKRRTVNGSVERNFLTACIISDKFLQEAISFYDPELIDTPYVRTVAEWCFRYHQQYGKAPGLHIKHIFDANVDRMDSVDREMMETLLSGLSEEHSRSDKLNVTYLLDQAENHFKALSLARLSRTISGLASGGDVAGAESELASYKRIGRPSSLGINPFKDPELFQRAFEQMETPLFRLPGKLGYMMNPTLNRDQFVALMGPEKRGKSWWLNELAIRAAKARCNVSLFQIGDMSSEQVTLRLGIRLAGRSNRERYCGDQCIPVPDCLLNQSKKCIRCPHSNVPLVETNPTELKAAFLSGKYKGHTPCNECVGERFFKGSLWYQSTHISSPLEWREAYKTARRFLERTKGRDFKLSVHPSESLTVTGLKGILDSWEMFEGFIPDVIVIDYVDNLAPESAREEPRHQVNRIWKMLRGLSQERHCLVITATQASAASYEVATMNTKHFSEDKRKFAHVNGMFGLNQTTEEKRAGLMRINSIVLREDEFFAEDEVYVAQAIWKGNPLLFSF